MKSVAVLGLFVVIMTAAAVYTTHQSAYAESNSKIEQPECTIYFDPETKKVAPGETFTVAVMVDDVNELWGYEIGIKFDRSVIEYAGVKLPYWRFVSGQIEYLFWVAGTSPQDGNVELLEFTFRGKAEGTSELSLYVHELATLRYWEAPKDYVGWPIAHDLSEGLVTVA